MIIERFEVRTLGQASYLLADGSDAAVVDPERNVRPYLEAAERRGAKLGWVLLTHLAEDFASGHLELAELTGATIGLGEASPATFPHHGFAHQARLPLGDSEIRVLATPGHAPEALCFLVLDAAGAPTALFSGDTLLPGDTGRLDHLPGPLEPRARQLFHSLRDHIRPLPADLPLHAGHYSGTLVCRRPAIRRDCALGWALSANPALGSGSFEDLHAWLRAGQPEVPAYFAQLREFNARSGGNLWHGSLPTISVDRFRRDIESGSPVLDARLTPAYNAGHIRGSVHVGLDGQFELWVGSAVRPGPGLRIVCRSEDTLEVGSRLARIGYEGEAAVLEGGLPAWQSAGFPVTTSGALSAVETAARLEGNAGWQLIDVRRAPEWEEGHASAALFIPMDQLRERASELDPGRPLAIVCRSGYRSSVAASQLEALGFRDLYNVTGGMLAWRAAGLPVVND